MEKRVKKFHETEAKADQDTDKMLEKFLKKNAIKEGEDYFDHVIYALKGKIEDVKKNKKNWKMAISGKAHPNGYVPDKKLVVEQIEWNIDTVRQINLCPSQGARAMVLLANAFQIQL